jgi:tRNA(Ile)-lysidine synthase
MEDSSNRDQRFLRNRIRRDILPRLTEIQPAIIETLGNTSEIIRDEDLYMESVAEDWLGNNCLSRKEEEVRISRPDFCNLPTAVQRRVVRASIRRIYQGSLRRIGMSHIRSVMDIAAGPTPQAAVNLPEGIKASREYETICFALGQKAGHEQFSLPIEGPGQFKMERQGLDFIFEYVERDDYLKFKPSLKTVHVDGDIAAFPLKLRNMRQGDRFMPLGMKGHKKIKDFFIDLKIPSPFRSRIPILFRGDLPVWLCGLRLDDRFKVTERTSRVLRITMRYDEGQSTFRHF